MTPRPGRNNDLRKLNPTGYVIAQDVSDTSLCDITRSETPATRWADPEGVCVVSETVADFLLGRLRDWDVDRVFGYAGDGINGLLAAWGRAGNDPQFVQARHEEMAAFEAVGYAKFSGRVGVCTATSGPGAIHLLNGLYDALLDHVPVVAIVGQTNRSAMGGSYQQEVDLPRCSRTCATTTCRRRRFPSSSPT